MIDLLQLLKDEFHRKYPEYYDFNNDYWFNPISNMVIRLTEDEDESIINLTICPSFDYQSDIQDYCISRRYGYYATKVVQYNYSITDPELIPKIDFHLEEALTLSLTTMQDIVAWYTGDYLTFYSRHKRCWKLKEGELHFGYFLEEDSSLNIWYHIVTEDKQFYYIEPIESISPLSEYSRVLLDKFPDIQPKNTL